MAPTEEYPVGAVVWAKIGSYPSWPSRVCDKGWFGNVKTKSGPGHRLVMFFNDGDQIAHLKLTELAPWKEGDEAPAQSSKRLTGVRSSTKKQLLGAMKLAAKYRVDWANRKRGGYMEQGYLTDSPSKKEMKTFLTNEDDEKEENEGEKSGFEEEEASDGEEEASDGEEEASGGEEEASDGEEEASGGEEEASDGEQKVNSAAEVPGDQSDGGSARTAKVPSRKGKSTSGNEKDRKSVRKSSQFGKKGLPKVPFSEARRPASPVAGATESKRQKDQRRLSVKSGRVTRPRSRGSERKADAELEQRGKSFLESDENKRFAAMTREELLGALALQVSLNKRLKKEVKEKNVKSNPDLSEKSHPQGRPYRSGQTGENGAASGKLRQGGRRSSDDTVLERGRDGDREDATDYADMCPPVSDYIDITPEKPGDKGTAKSLLRVSPRSRMDISPAPLGRRGSEDERSSKDHLRANRTRRTESVGARSVPEEVVSTPSGRNSKRRGAGQRLGTKRQIGSGGEADAENGRKHVSPSSSGTGAGNRSSSLSPPTVHLGDERSFVQALGKLSECVELYCNAAEAVELDPKLKGERGIYARLSNEVGAVSKALECVRLFDVSRDILLRTSAGRKLIDHIKILMPINEPLALQLKGVVTGWADAWSKTKLEASADERAGGKLEEKSVEHVEDKAIPVIVSFGDSRNLANETFSEFFVKLNACDRSADSFPRQSEEQLTGLAEEVEVTLFDRQKAVDGSALRDDGPLPESYQEEMQAVGKVLAKAFKAASRCQKGDEPIDDERFALVVKLFNEQIEAGPFVDDCLSLVGKGGTRSRGGTPCRGGTRSRGGTPCRGVTRSRGGTPCRAIKSEPVGRPTKRPRT